MANNLVDIVLIHFNNYFNRKLIAPGAVLSAYTAYDTLYKTYNNINFNPNDGVETTLVVGKGETLSQYQALDSYDYLLVVDGSNTNKPVLSRWFIMDRERTRDNQYRLILRRDVLVDNLFAALNAPVFIEKGMITDMTDPLFYNSENMQFNQIKTEETLLKDSTGCGWVVGYIPQDAFIDAPKTIIKEAIIQSTADISVNGIANWTYYPLTQLSTSRQLWTTANSPTKQIVLDTIEYWPANAGAGISSKTRYGKLYVPQGGTVTAVEGGVIGSGVTASHSAAFISTTFNCTQVAGSMPSSTSLWNNVTSVLTNMGIGGSIQTKTSTVINNVIALNNKTIKDTSTGSVYRIKVLNVGAGEIGNLDSSVTGAATLLSSINSTITRSYTISGGSTVAVTGDYGYDDVAIGYSASGYQILLEQSYTYAGVEIDRFRNHVVDAPYDIFCLPYSDTKKVKIDSSHTVTCNKELAIAIAQEIAKDAGAGSVYDTQLLPYCPSQELVNKNASIYEDEATIDLTGLSIDIIKDATDTFTQLNNITNQSTLETQISNHGTIYDANKNPIYYYSSSTTYWYRNASSGNYLGAIVWCTSATRSFDIDQPIYPASIPIKRKVQSETEFYRLCSGNYQGMFEFNAAKSFGVDGFRVDCTFKPYNPYIHVIPKLGGIYGSNFAGFKDARGLICGGDFSLAQLSNTWANYELQNKNYQNIFDRQIQNLDVNNKIAKSEAVISAIAGTVQGGVAGAGAGFMAGGGTGALAGGIAGTIASGIGGIVDVTNLNKRQEEARSYAIDMYGYNLQNIQAIPTSLSKNTALTANTKIFPFIEKYTCTNEEKEALENKLTYNGMTVMKIGTMSGWTGFFKGQVIRLDDLKDDSHMANAIYEEINKGVYL